jgi:hypothetical protein
VHDDFRYFVESQVRVTDRLAPNSRDLGLPKIRPERLAAAATEVVGVMLRKDQDPSAKPVPRKHTEASFVEVRA